MTGLDAAAAAPDWMHDLLDQGVLITDADLTIRSWNAWLTQRSGRPAAEVLGRGLLELYPELATRQLDRAYREALAGRVQVLSQRLHRYLLPLTAEGGVQMAQSARIGPLLAGGQVVGTITIIEDVTERVAREQELQRLLEQERAARAASEHAEQRYRALVQVSSQAIWTADAQGRTSDFNIWWGELTGQPETSFDGWNWLDVVHPDDREPTRIAWSQALQKRTPYRIAYRVRTRDGSYRMFAVHGVPVLDAEGRFREWVGTFNDITESRRAEEATKLLADASAALLLDANAVLSSSLDYTRRLQVLAWLVLERLADGCVVYLAEVNAPLRPVVAAHASAPKQQILDAWLQRPERAAGSVETLAAHVFQTGEARFISDLNPERLRELGAEEPLQELSAHLGVRSGMLVPLRVNSVTFGVLALVISETGRRYDQFDLDVAQELARRAALMLDNARAYMAESQARKAAERAAARITRLQVVTAEFAQALTPIQIVETVIRAVSAALDAAASCVMQLSVDGSALEQLYAVGYPEEVRTAWERIPLERNVPFTEAIRSGATVVIESEADRARYPELGQALEDAPFRGLIAAPLVLGAGALGVLGLSFAEFRPFATEDRDFLQALTHQCAQALERAWLYEAEQRARAEAEAAVQVRDQFLSIASHELRTPLTSLLGNIQILQRRLTREGTLSERDQHALRVASDQSLRLNRMIGALLDVSRIEQGLLNLDRVPMDLCALVRRVVEEAQPTSAQHRLVADLPGAPLLVDGDALRLEQVLQNLLGNAIKYSPEGGQVTVSVTLRGQMVCVAVADQGIGIPHDILPKLFQRFYRAPNALAHKIDGTGVGLYVVREIVHLHDGQLDVDSVEGVGSTFTVCLPLSVAADWAGASGAVTAEPGR